METKTDLFKTVAEILSKNMEEGEGKNVSGLFGLDDDRHEKLTDADIIGPLFQNPDTKTELLVNICNYISENAENEMEAVYLFYHIISVWAGSHATIALKAGMLKSMLGGIL
jgi:hypothetical protein